MSNESVNALAQASSPYLRSAMHQPIRWHEWGEEAFATAQRESKPILLDIGAVWCHWCHVMDRESYDNPDVARLVNQHFVAVKVDRDERPDVDSRYQAAVQAISGQGGWPLTAFLTPDGKPFYGGTYFPPDDHLGRPGFKRVLEGIANAYREKHGDVMESAQAVMSVIEHAESPGQASKFDPGVVERIIANAKSMFDAHNGGFGGAPKFPHPAVLDLLIDHYSRSGDPETCKAVVTTLEKMARGGVYDQLAGGFHRYSTDEHWTVPHFEKMSYDNSELLKNYVHAFQATGNEFFAEVARDIIRWMDEWLSASVHGGFYASQDADISMDDDGDYFTWTREEARTALNDEEFEVAALHYDINEIGEMHHNPARNVLFQRAPVEEIARRTGKTVEQVQAILDTAKSKLYAARLQRPTPYVDKTLYVGWNALCISAYLQAAQALDIPDARRFALRSLDRILSQGWEPKRGLAHVIAYSERKPVKPELRGVLDDYAFTVSACLDAYEATADMTYFNFARRIADAMLEKFYDPKDGGFFDTEREGGNRLGALSAARKPFQDAPTPAGNSSAVVALLRLHSYTNDARYHEAAEKTLNLFAGVADQFGIFAASYGIAAVSFAKPHTQVVVVGNDEAAQQLYRAAVAPFALNKAVLCLPGENEATPQNLPPALSETIPNLPGIREGRRSFAVLCSDFACRPPLYEPAVLTAELRAAITGVPGKVKEPAA
ncbi:MAG: thioredoxin domain-containing protein [Terriglobales bacterium]